MKRREEILFSRVISCVSRVRVCIKYTHVNVSPVFRVERTKNLSKKKKITFFERERVDVWWVFETLNTRLFFPCLEISSFCFFRARHIAS